MLRCRPQRSVFLISSAHGPAIAGKGYTGKPQLSSGFSEAEELGGYSTEWRNADGSPKWNLCQAMYGYHKLMGMSPAIFYNIFDPAKHKKAVAVEEFTVTDHIVELTADAIINDDLKVTAGSASTALTKGTRLRGILQRQCAVYRAAGRFFELQRR